MQHYKRTVTLLCGAVMGAFLCSGASAAEKLTFYPTDSDSCRSISPPSTPFPPVKPAPNGVTASEALNHNQCLKGSGHSVFYVLVQGDKVWMQTQSFNPGLTVLACGQGGATRTILISSQKADSGNGFQCTFKY